MAVVTGTSGNDTLNGTSGDDTINGLAGNDVITPGLGYDTVDGGTGTDVLVIDYSANTNYGINTNFNSSDRSSGYVTDLGFNQVYFSNIERYNITGTGVADNIYGAANNDTLIGGAGNDTLDAGAGNDTLNGGAGDDYLYIGSGTDSVDGGTGTDKLIFDYSAGTTAINLTGTSSGTVGSTGAGSVTYNNIEVFDVTATNYNDTITGAANDDTLNSLAGDDVITPGLGRDRVDGGTGTDVLVIDYSANTNYGINTNFNSSDRSSGSISSYTGSGFNVVYFSNIERYKITGTGASDDIKGAANNDTLIGGAGDDYLYIGSGTDSVDGGTGTDKLIFDYSAGTTAINLTGTSSGTVSSPGAGSVTYNNIEVFNVIATNYHDTLIGGAGNDLLDARAGNDTLNGGAGDDYLYIGSGTDSVDGGTGTDKLIFDYSAGTTAINLTGTSSSTVGSTGAGSVTYSNIEVFDVTATNYNDTITGAANNDTLNSLAGDDVIAPGLGQDIVDGGSGTDVLVIDYSANTYSGISTNLSNSDRSSGYINAYDTANSYNQVVFSNIERYNITGTEASDDIKGAALNDTLIGGAGNDTLDAGAGDDTLNGGAGDDTLIGGNGNDTYVVDTASDSITETATGGIDTIQSSVTWTLASYLENLTLTGASAINGTGNTLNNVITGNSANNTLSGLAGNDTLDGSGGTDTLVGGDGNDTYIVDTTTDTITEAATASAGIDTIQSSVTYTLTAANVENLTLSGTSNINGTGSSINNTIRGNSGANTINGGAGVDTLIGGDGNDRYIVDTTTDTITETATGGIDTVQSSISYSLASNANVENLTLTGSSNINGTGNSLANIITSNSGINTLTGGDGNDTYIINNTADIITETATGGIDKVNSGVSYALGDNVENLTLTGTSNINGTGNTQGNIITGNSGANILNGGAGIDTLAGGDGNDTYIVDSTTDTITETTTGGTDTVQSSVSYTIGDNIENLTLTGSNDINGTGNNLNNVITSNSGINTVSGGNGNDTYIIDSASDIITETTTGGIDTVKIGVTYTLGATSNLENLTLTGTSAINGTGNSLNNSIIGNNANNILNGGTGADTLIGGLGNDIYYADNVGDVVNEELSTGGVDTLYSYITWTLAEGSNVENLTLLGTTAINGTGNSLNNTITGNTGNNTLTGNDGNDVLTGMDGNDILVGGNANDTLTGGNGADSFRFNASNEGIDTIKDFSAAGSDIIQILASGFGGRLVAGTTLSANQFISGAGVTSAGTADQRFIYNTSNGALFYDADGNGAGLSSQIATISPVSNVIPALSNSNIFVI